MSCFIKYLSLFLLPITAFAIEFNVPISGSATVCYEVDSCRNSESGCIYPQQLAAHAAEVNSQKRDGTFFGCTRRVSDFTYRNQSSNTGSMVCFETVATADFHCSFSW